MLNVLKSFVWEIIFGDIGKKIFVEDDKWLVVVVFLFYLIDIDGVVEDSESIKLCQIFQVYYGLIDQEIMELIVVVKQCDEEVVDFYGFMFVFKCMIEEDECLVIIEMMWEIVYVDGYVYEFEDNIIWWVVELFGVFLCDWMVLCYKVVKFVLEGDVVKEG